MAKDVHSLFLNIVENPHEVEAFHTHTHTHTHEHTPNHSQAKVLPNRWVLRNILQIFLVSLQPGLSPFN